MTPTMEQIKEWMTDAGISHLSEPLERFADLAFAAGSRSSSTDNAELVPELERIEEALPRLAEVSRAPVCVTLGERGMYVSHPVPTLVPGVVLLGPLDSTGAGDSATAGCVLALASAASLPEAALVGNLVASITVQQLAVTGTATPAQLLDRLAIWRKQRE